MNKFERFENLLLEDKKKVKPFVKWAGGKARLAETIISHFPKNFNDYHEPFVGAGGLFFALINKGLLDNKKIRLSDLNHELINTYLSIMYEPERLISLLEDNKKNHCKEWFEVQKARKIFLCREEISSRFIYLNQACYNGLYRVNKKGEFNTAYGKGNKNRKENTININKGLIYSIFRVLNNINVDVFCDLYTYCLPRMEIWFIVTHHTMRRLLNTLKMALGKKTK